MELGIYGLFDLKAKIYDTPWFAFDNLQAKRRLQILLDEEKTVIAKWPEEFHLVKYGTFDNKGKIKLNGIEVIATGDQFKKQEK